MWLEGGGTAAPHLQQWCPSFASELAPESWDGTEGAGVVTALSHPQVSRVPRREPVPVPLGPERHCGITNLA